MRTWILAPDSTWTEVTDRLGEHDGDPAYWPWPEIVAALGAPAILDEYTVIERDGLAGIHRQIGDQWIARRVWDVLCSPGITNVTVLHVTPHSRSRWLDALAAWTGRDGRPHYHWTDRRYRWMLWAHAEDEVTPPLDGAYMVVGATRST
jgi:hypothetical protein